MLRIPCPWCGVRDETEFRFGGEAHVERPGLEVSDAEWADYLFNRENPKGLHYERWCHVYGCSQWFNVVRDTVTHEIHAVYEMGEAKPDIKMTDH
ncbi:MAG: sarcosine oxidase subunit delta [Proteobacteria bacterium]|nr:sarcosine oxidase subunit delta [Pseudomonadota bacterium]